MEKKRKPCYTSCVSNYEGHCLRAGYKERERNSADNPFKFRLCPFSNPSKAIDSKVEEESEQIPPNITELNPNTLKNPPKSPNFVAIFRKGLRGPDGLAIIITGAGGLLAYLTYLSYRLANTKPPVNDPLYRFAQDLYQYIEPLINS